MSLKLNSQVKIDFLESTEQVFSFHSEHFHFLYFFSFKIQGKRSSFDYNHDFIYTISYQTLTPNKQSSFC